MHIVIGIVVLFMIGFAMQVFDAVGGWPGVFLIVGGIAAGGWALTSALNRRDAIKRLREKPARVTALAATKPEILLGEIFQELEAGRAPLFWDAFDARCQELSDASDALDLARREANAYEEGARKYGLYPSRVEFETEDNAFQAFAGAYASMLREIRDGVLDKPDFSIVYEHRRGNEENRALHRALLQDLAVVGETAQAALEAAKEASGEARRARGAAKRASRDWF